MPFRYGIATMTDVPQVVVRIWVKTTWGETVGFSSDLLPPKWFTKVPDKPLEAEIAEMLGVIAQARTLAQGLQALTPFDLWETLYRLQDQWAEQQHLPPLLAHFGTSLIERAMLDAVCRAARQPLANMLHQNKLGVDLARIHPELASATIAQLLPAPLPRLTVRHTVGLADPLAGRDISPGEQLSDSLPQSLEAAVRQYGLRHLKIKVSGRVSEDLPRLRALAAMAHESIPHGFAFSLDGNEQFKSMLEFREFWRAVTKPPALRRFFESLLFVEQPLHRDVALDPSVRASLMDWNDRPPIIIDESDARLHDAARAIELGYAGTSHKNCKGVFKGLANRCLLAAASRKQASRRLIMSGEDLCNTGPISLHQDLAVMALLGIESVERNGHHYHPGLSQFPLALQAQTLSAHPDLYELSSCGWPALKIEQGTVSLASINRSPFGVGFVPDLTGYRDV